MFEKTNNPYRWKYLITGITGKGIDCVYLPPKPPDADIIDLGGGWKRQDLPKGYHDWVKEEKLRESEGFAHPLLQAYIQQQWDYRLNGMWFWNTVNGKREATYITGLYWFHLQWWPLVRGYPEFRDPIREIFYWWDYICEDPVAYGGILGAMRRLGKSAIMGTMSLEPILRTPNARTGIQGEKDEKAKKFYLQHILKPFRKIPSFFRPMYDTSYGLTNGIFFRKSISRGKSQEEELNDEDSLDSYIDFGPTDVNHYNGEELFRWILEEGGKIKKCDVMELWTAMKDTLLVPGVGLVGKGLCATTADADGDTGEVTASFRELVTLSDVNNRKENGETQSGLYAAFMPSQHVFSTPTNNPPCFDKFGIPYSERNKELILKNRPSISANPALYSAECRKRPLTWDEYFYVNADKCQFDVMVLQERKRELDLIKQPYERFKLEWSDTNRNRVIATPHPNGYHMFSWMPVTGALNQVLDSGGTGYERFVPLNDKIIIGHDPIAFGSLTSNRRASKPVAISIRKYDALVDGDLTEERKEFNRQTKYKYQTGKPIHVYNHRPDDPKVYCEEIVKLVHFLGCEINIERSAYSALVTEYMKMRGYSRFIMKKDAKGFSVKESDKVTEGTNAAAQTTQYYTNLVASFVYAFGHCIDFPFLLDELLLFDPNKTTEFDHVVALGMALIGDEKYKPDETEPIDVSSVFRVYNINGNSSSLNNQRRTAY